MENERSQRRKNNKAKIPEERKLFKPKPKWKIQLERNANLKETMKKKQIEKK